MYVQVDEQYIAKHQGTEVVCVRHGGSEGDGPCHVVTYSCWWPVQVISQLVSASLAEPRTCCYPSKVVYILSSLFLALFMGIN